MQGHLMVATAFFLMGRSEYGGTPRHVTVWLPALCVLEKLVHIEDPTLLPALMMVR